MPVTVGIVATNAWLGNVKSAGPNGRAGMLVAGRVTLIPVTTMLLSNPSTMSKFSIVCPGAILTVNTYCRGKFGPVAVSFSGPT